MVDPLGREPPPVTWKLDVLLVGGPLHGRVITGIPEYQREVVYEEPPLEMVSLGDMLTFPPRKRYTLDRWRNCGHHYDIRFRVGHREEESRPTAEYVIQTIHELPPDKRALFGYL